MDFISENTIDIAVNAGSIVLENGGETYRAEDTIVYTMKALGEKKVSAFATPTVIIASCTDEQNRHFTAMRRIKSRTVNLRKIVLVNALSQGLISGKAVVNPEQVSHMLSEINNTKSYPNWLMILSASLSSFFFAPLFGGGIKDAIVSFVIGSFLRFFLLFIEKISLSGFIRSMLFGAIISLLSDTAKAFHIIDSPLVVMTAVLMQVVPGLAIVNAIRDIIAGDLVAGNARAVEAFTIAAGLSAGSVFGLLVMRALT